MNLNDQIDALDAGVDQLLHDHHAAQQAARSAEAFARAAATEAEAAAQRHAAAEAGAEAAAQRHAIAIAEAEAAARRHAEATAQAEAVAQRHADAIAEAEAAAQRHAKAIADAEALVEAVVKEAVTAETVEAVEAPAPAAEAHAPAATEVEAAAETESAPADAPAEAAADASAAPADQSTLHVSRPSQNELTLTVNGESITLHPEQLSQLIEELAHARASMQPEQPAGIPAGWRFVSTKNPVMAVQKQSNGDRLLVARHTGYGWVPFTFSPDVVIQMYMMLTQR